MCYYKSTQNVRNEVMRTVLTYDAALAGRILRHLRGKESLEKVAKTVKISANALDMYERGLRLPRDEVKSRLARYYGVTVGAIFLRTKYTKCE